MSKSVAEPVQRDAAGEIQHPLLEEPTNSFDRGLSWLADNSSPLVVKEIRQAVNSRAFFYTFLLLLIAMVAWSFVGLSFVISDDITSGGANMMSGYLVMLGVPLFVVLPFSTFRSMIAEYEDDTFHLISITKLSGRGIIYGKLASALSQIGVYLSAIVPGITFCYLLQDLSLFEIFSFLLMAVMLSIGLIGLGLALAGIGRQIVLRFMAYLAILIACVIAFIAFWISQAEILVGRFVFLGWQIPFGFSLFIFGLALLLTEGAVSANSFFAENRSTNIRLAFVVFLFCLITVVMVSSSDTLFIDAEFTSVVWYLSVGIGHLVALFGCMAAAEYPIISHRARRGIPNNPWLHALVAVLLPGPGRGYLCSIALIWGLIGGLVFFLPLASHLARFQLFQGISNLFVTNSSIAAFYHAAMATIFVSLTYLFCRYLGTRLPRPSPIVGAVFAAILYTLSTLFPLILYGFFKYFDANSSESDLLLTALFAWGIVSQLDPDYMISQIPPIYLSANAVVAAVLFIICFSLAAREISLPQSMVPAKVQAEIDARRRKSVAHDEETIEELFQNRR